jgi:hypothetical protein
MVLHVFPQLPNLSTLECEREERKKERTFLAVLRFTVMGQTASAGVWLEPMMMMMYVLVEKSIHILSQISAE